MKQKMNLASLAIQKFESLTRSQLKYVLGGSANNICRGECVHVTGSWKYSSPASVEECQNDGDLYCDGDYLCYEC